jgi:glutamine synthetase
LRSLSAITNELNAEFGLTPIVGGEIECYVMLPDESSKEMDTFWEPVQKAFHHEGLPILRIEKERGLHQYEIVTSIMPVPELVHCLGRVRSIIEKYATRMNVVASFAGKPFADQPSSGIHIHLHLADETGLNAYQKTEDFTSDALRHSLGGLLDALLRDMPIFFPNREDYARLGDTDHVPKIHGWGVNNRYCALRIPATPDPYDKRIEHRVACANADPEAVIAAILEGVYTGLCNQIEPPVQEYGKKADVTLHQLALASV